MKIEHTFILVNALNLENAQSNALYDANEPLLNKAFAHHVVRDVLLNTSPP